MSTDDDVEVDGRYIRVGEFGKVIEQIAIRAGMKKVFAGR